MDMVVRIRSEDVEESFLSRVLVVRGAWNNDIQLHGFGFKKKYNGRNVFIGDKYYANAPQLLKQFAKMSGYVVLPPARRVSQDMTLKKSIDFFGLGNLLWVICFLLVVSTIGDGIHASWMMKGITTLVLLVVIWLVSNLKNAGTVKLEGNALIDKPFGTLFHQESVVKICDIMEAQLCSVVTGFYSGRSKSGVICENRLYLITRDFELHVIRLNSLSGEAVKSLTEQLKNAGVSVGKS